MVQNNYFFINKNIINGIENYTKKFAQRHKLDDTFETTKG